MVGLILWSCSLTLVTYARRGSASLIVIPLFRCSPHTVSLALDPPRRFRRMERVTVVRGEQNNLGLIHGLPAGLLGVSLPRCVPCAEGSVPRPAGSLLPCQLWRHAGCSLA